ncbi:hypothetical protein R1flu_011394 [Riccia fluitans]|uniref:Uncharacterized protein n=1 Tax=Riccia fluitans TaxID=41844 RepID=A0ABD1ZAX5_9MARC
MAVFIEAPGIEEGPCEETTDLPATLADGSRQIDKGFLPSPPNLSATQEFCAIPSWVSTRSSEGSCLHSISRGTDQLFKSQATSQAPFTWIKKDFAGDSVQTRGLFRRVWHGFRRVCLHAV